MTGFEGQTFAGYEIIAKLGQGGMGAVFKARQPKLDRLAALKILATDLASDPDFVARFKREAAAAANLSHPNIVQVYSAGESEGTHYIAMEFVDGQTLRDYIDQHGRLDPREAVAITVYVAEALQYAWNRAKLIHRDIKPENIFLSRTGEVKVGDLGLAKTVGGQTTSLTQTGTAMGSPHYISPEQATGAKEMDFRTDIYSLGGTLYHMLTGQTPYSGDSSMVVMMKHVNDPPPAIFKVWPQCPMPLGLLVGKMLAKNRNSRPASYEELIEQLRSLHDKLKPATVPAAAPVSPSDPTQLLTPTPKPAPAPAQPTPKPVITKTPTVAPKARESKSVTRNSKLLIGVGALAAVVLIAGTVWWFAGSEGGPKVLDLGDGVKMELAAIPAGEFMLGSTAVERAWTAAQPDCDPVTNEGDAPRKATIKHRFWMGRTEATFGQWKQFVNATGYKTEVERFDITVWAYDPTQKKWGPRKGVTWRDPGFGFVMQDNHPVCCVTWGDAMAFCDWLSQREQAAGRLPAGYKFRLPTEAEWEYACRAGTQTKFWWGDSVEDAQGRVNWAGDEDGFECMHPVDHYGARGRNAFGLADMIGNVPEWCLDGWDPNGAHEEFYAGPPDSRAMRGAPFWGVPGQARCASRCGPPTSSAWSGYGFRVCLGPNVLGSAAAAAAVPATGPESRVTSAAENWQDWMAEQRKSGKIPDNFKDDGGAWVKTKPGGLTRLAYFMRDGAARVTSTLPDREEATMALDLRWAKDGGTYQCAVMRQSVFLYLAEPVTSGQSEGLSRNLRSLKTLKSWPLPAGVDPNQEITLEFRAVGEELSVKVNDQFMGTVRDSTYSREGEVAFYCKEAGARVSRIEVLNLDGVSTSALRTLQSAIAPAAAWQNAINLLPLIDPQKDAVAGRWKVANGELSVSSNTFARLQIPYRPPEEYDFRIVFSRQSGKEAIQQILVGGRRQFDCCLAGVRGDWFGFESIGGKWANANPSGVKMVGAIEDGRRYTSLVQVRKDGVKGFLDDRQITEWKTDYQDMSLPEGLLLRDGQSLGIGAYGISATFHRIEVREVTGKGAFTRGAPAGVAPQPRQTIDLLALTDPVKDRVQAVGGTIPSKANVWERRDRALVYVSDGSSGKLVPPVAIHARNYEIEIHYERLSGSGGFLVDLPIEGSQLVSVYVDVPGFRTINSRIGRAWPSNTAKHGCVVVRMDRGENGSNDHITVHLDGELWEDWTGDLHALESRKGEPHPDFPGRLMFSLFARKDNYKFTTWTLRVFNGEATMLREPASAAPVTRPASFVPPDATVWQNAINLLPLIDPQKDAVKGQWRIENGDLVGNGNVASSWARVEIPYQPPEEYDFRVVFSRKTGGGAIWQVLVGGDRSFNWCLAGYEGKWFGFEKIAGKGCNGNPSSVPMEQNLENGRHYTSEVQIRRDGVKAFLDGRFITEWKTNYQDMGLWTDLKLHTERSLGIGAVCSTTFHRIEVREVTGKGTFTRGAPSGASTTPILQHSTALAPWLSAFCAEVAALPAEQQVARVVAKLKELNPGFGGKATHNIVDGEVEEFRFSTSSLRDISPVRAFAKLKRLTCEGYSKQNNLLSDLSPLRGLQLDSCGLTYTQVSDLSPLSGMPLRTLQVTGTKVHDLSSLRGMPLEVLYCDGTQVADLTPLAGMPLKELDVRWTRITVLSPLREMPLTRLRCNFDPQRDTAVLRSIKTLEKINDLPVAEFWKKVDAGEVPKP